LPKIATKTKLVLGAQAGAGAYTFPLALSAILCETTPATE